MYPIKSLLKGPILAYNMADLFHQRVFLEVVSIVTVRKVIKISILLAHLLLQACISFQNEYFGLMPIYILLKNLLSSTNECIP